MPDGMQPSPAPMAGAKPPMVPPGSTAPATMAPDSQGLQMRGVIQITPHIKGLERAVSYVGSQTPEGQAILKALAILSKAFGTASGDLTRAEMKIMSETAPPIAPPSGTAIAIQQVIRESSAQAEALQITSFREGDVVGLHEVVLESGHDRIYLCHDAKSRRGFAEGAVRAAEWLQGKKGFYAFKDIWREL